MFYGKFFCLNPVASNTIKRDTQKLIDAMLPATLIAGDPALEEVAATVKERMTEDVVKQVIGCGDFSVKFDISEKAHEQLAARNKDEQMDGMEAAIAFPVFHPRVEVKIEQCIGKDNIAYNEFMRMAARYAALDEMLYATVRAHFVEDAEDNKFNNISIMRFLHIVIEPDVLFIGGDGKVNRATQAAIHDLLYTGFGLQQRVLDNHDMMMQMLAIFLPKYTYELYAFGSNPLPKRYMRAFKAIHHM